MQKGFFAKLKDHNSTVHKLMTYGVALLCLLFAIFKTPGKEHLSSSVGTYLILFILYYTIVSKRILETLIWACAIGVAMLSGTNFVSGFQDQIYATMASGDFAWIVLMCCFLNVFNKLLTKTGSLFSFSKIVRKRVRNKKDLNLATWLMQFPLFFDDYMTIAIGGNIMGPMYDELDVPREEGAYLIHTLAEPLRVLLPITSWAAFMGGLFAAGGLNADGTGMHAFFRSIPYNFYAIVSIIGTLLFALGILPRVGAMKRPMPEEYEEFEVLESEKTDGKHGTLVDFFLPIVGMLVAAYFFDFDIVPAMLLILPLTAGYYLIRGIIDTDDVEEALVDGFAEFMSLIILFLASYMLNDVLSNLGYVDYLAGIVGASISPKLLPVAIYVLFCLSECIMSLNWGLLLIAFPMLLPVATSIGANPYLTAAAMISAGCFGCNMCYICDYTMLTSSVFGLKPAHHADTCVPYSVLFAVISGILFLIAGLVL